MASMIPKMYSHAKAAIIGTVTKIKPARTSRIPLIHRTHHILECNAGDILGKVFIICTNPNRLIVRQSRFA
jgi:hypothetical protein